MERDIYRFYMTAFLQCLILTMVPYARAETHCSETLQHKKSCWVWLILSPRLYIFIRMGCST